MFSTVCLLVLCSFILNRNILGFSGVEREIVILCNVMLSKILLDPSLKGFLSKFYCKLSHPILNGYKLVVPATFLCPVVHNAFVALFLYYISCEPCYQQSLLSPLVTRQQVEQRHYIKHTMGIVLFFNSGTMYQGVLSLQ